jgi:hypothetical protein
MECFRTGSNCGLLWAWQWTFMLHKIKGFLDQLSYSQLIKQPLHICVTYLYRVEIWRLCQRHTMDFRYARSQRRLPRFLDLAAQPPNNLTAAKKVWHNIPHSIGLLVPKEKKRGTELPCFPESKSDMKRNVCTVHRSLITKARAVPLHAMKVLGE